MLNVNRINKSYNLDTILTDITFSVKKDQRVAIVGANGCGKTTLFRIIMGEQKPDSGTVQFNPAGLRIGYLPQGLTFSEEETLQSYLSKSVQSSESLQREFESIAVQLALEPDNQDLHTRYDQLLNQLSTSISSTGDQAEVLAALDLGDHSLNTPIAHLSGGQKTRLALAAIILDQPKLLLLDEPTNHLDIHMLEWLEHWLNHFQGAALIISHDRTFLDNTVNAILRIDTRTHKLTRYEGNYSTYLEQRMVEQEREWQAYTDQQDEIARLTSAATHMRSLGKFRKGGKSDVNAGTDGFSAGHFANRALETTQKAKSIEKRVDKLLNEDHISKPKSDWEMKMDFTSTLDSGRDVLILDSLAIGYDGVPLLENLNMILGFGKRCVLTGRNGSGKTTLIKTIMKVIPPVNGQVRLGSNVKVGYMAQEQETLDPESTPLDTLYRLTPLNETETRHMLSKYLFKGDDVFKRNASLSYGERARLTLACLVAEGCNFLILDEPINHLDIPSRTQFEKALTTFEGTVLAVVHDRYFIEQFATERWEVKDNTIQQIYLT
jgi:ATP-binding cassette subfamily F protein 3